MATPKAPQGKGPRRTAEDEDPEKYPNLAAAKDWDKAQHVKKGIEAGLTKKQAQRHADDEVRED
ncbi:MAG TPA: hypothetical protein VM286_02210 [Candidatus Thermoplasmatota archaeon]|nr:hypothetical protein [Candidatus Thermoplasmatota archaeon]